MNILLLEPFPADFRRIQEALNHAQINVERAKKGKDVLKLARNGNNDLLILESMLPEIAGLEVIRQLRDQENHIPILLLSEDSRPQTIATALDAGADDFVTKPFNKEELVARIKAVMRRTGGRGGYSKSLLEVGPLALDLATHKVTLYGKPVQMTALPFAVLELLMLRADKLVSKEDLMNHVYGTDGDNANTHSLDINISRLRDALKKAGAPEMIGTVWGKGLVLTKPKNTSRYAVTEIAPADVSVGFGESAISMQEPAAKGVGTGKPKRSPQSCTSTTDKHPLRTGP